MISKLEVKRDEAEDEDVLVMKAEPKVEKLVLPLPVEAEEKAPISKDSSVKAYAEHLRR